MYIIKMEEDKRLSPTITIPIYQGERNADTLIFLLPLQYGGCLLSSCAVTLKYILPNGNGRMETLTLLDDNYKGFTRYCMPIDSKITSQFGEVILWLTIYSENQVVVKSDSTVIRIEESRDITEYIPEEEQSVFDDLFARVVQLEAAKADNLYYDADGAYMQLMSGAVPIGDRADLSGLGGSGTGSGGSGGGSDDYNDLRNLPIVNLDGTNTPVIITQQASGIYRIHKSWRFSPTSQIYAANESDLFYVYIHDSICRMTRIGAESISEYMYNINTGTVTENYYLTEQDSIADMWGTF